MNWKHVLVIGVGAAVVLGGVGGVEAKGSGAGTGVSLRLTKHLRVDGSSDLRGTVHARGGLKVTAGIDADSVYTTGPVRVGGILTVVGLATTNGLNAGSGQIMTTGAMQAGALGVSGDSAMAGNLQIGKSVTVGGALQAGSLTTSSLTDTGTLTAGSISTGGSVTAGSFSTGGSINAGSATFSKLAVTAGGSINFNNASITGVSGLTLGGNAQLASLQLNTVSSGGVNGTQALTITQNGVTSSLSVGSGGFLVVAGNGLAANALSVTNDATVNGILNASRISSTSKIALNSPNVTTNGLLEVGSGGALQLDTGGSGTSHIVGNHDTRGQCSVSVAADASVKTCSISFSQNYGSTPAVVVAPAGSDPTFITDYTVQSSSGGFNIRFTNSGGGTATFNYIVQG